MLQKKGKYRGKVYAGLYAGDGKGTQQRIQWQLNYYIAKAFGIKDHAHTKADGHYACPNCGAILEIGEDGYYCCPSCSWTEMDFWEQELDEVTIYGEGGSNGNNPDPFPDPENPNQPDPNTGGDEGGGGNNGSSPDNPTDSIPEQRTIFLFLIPAPHDGGMLSPVITMNLHLIITPE